MAGSPDLLWEQMYYDAARQGIDRGYQMSGVAPPDDLPEDVDESLKAFARRQARQLQRIAVDDPDQRAAVAELLDEWLASGEDLSLTDLRDGLRVHFGSMRALRIARTESAWAMNTGAASAARSAGFEHVTWNAALDACPGCTELHGKLMTMDEYLENSVLHPNCRCSFLAADSPDKEDANLDEAAEALGQPEDEIGEGDLDREALKVRKSAKGASLKSFNPDQPRDEDGRFGEGGDGSGGEKEPQKEVRSLEQMASDFAEFSKASGDPDARVYTAGTGSMYVEAHGMTFRFADHSGPSWRQPSWDQQADGADVSAEEFLSVKTQPESLLGRIGAARMRIRDDRRELRNAFEELSRRDIAGLARGTQRRLERILAGEVGGRKR